MSVTTQTKSFTHFSVAPSFQIEQSASQLTLQSKEPWERLRLLDTAGSTLCESMGALADKWDIEGLATGVYWVVAEWVGTRSSRAIVID
jgi:hypothetical protein